MNEPHFFIAIAIPESPAIRNRIAVVPTVMFSQSSISASIFTAPARVRTATPKASSAAAIETRVFGLMTFPSSVMMERIACPKTQNAATSVAIAMVTPATESVMFPFWNTASRLLTPFRMFFTASPSPTSAAAVPHSVAAFRAVAFRLSMALLNFLVEGVSSFPAITSPAPNARMVVMMSWNRSSGTCAITHMAPARTRMDTAMFRIASLDWFFCQVFSALVSCLKLPAMASKALVTGPLNRSPTRLEKLLDAFANCPMLNASSPTSIKLRR